jgi:G3E family GTPase
MLNKIDLVDEAEREAYLTDLEAEIRELNPSVELIRTQQAAVSLDFFINPP